jgi:hypothetical protein
MLIFLLLCAALICFGIEAFRTRSLLCLGLALWALVLVIERWPG